MRRLLIALLLLVLFPVTAEAALPLHRGVAIHEWLNWAPLAEDGSYRWPPYRSVADWLSASRPAPDWPKGNQFARIRAMGFDFVRLSVDPGPLLATSGDRRRQALADPWRQPRVLWLLCALGALPGLAGSAAYATSALPAPGVTDTPMPAKDLRITLPVITTSRRYLPQPATMPNAGAFSMTLPVTEVSAST